MSKYDKDIIRMARENKTRKEIAEALGISDVYVSWLCHKMRKNGTKADSQHYRMSIGKCIYGQLPLKQVQLLRVPQLINLT